MERRLAEGPERACECLFDIQLSWEMTAHLTVYIGRRVETSVLVSEDVGPLK